jgi:hypothetical protein
MKIKPNKISLLSGWFFFQDLWLDYKEPSAESALILKKTT